MWKSDRDVQQGLEHGNEYDTEVFGQSTKLARFKLPKRKRLDDYLYDLLHIFGIDRLVIIFGAYVAIVLCTYSTS